MLGSGTFSQESESQFRTPIWCLSDDPVTKFRRSFLASDSDGKYTQMNEGSSDEMKKEMDKRLPVICKTPDRESTIGALFSFGAVLHCNMLCDPFGSQTNTEKIEIYVVGSIQIRWCTLNEYLSEGSYTSSIHGSDRRSAKRR